MDDEELLFGYHESIYYTWQIFAAAVLIGVPLLLAATYKIYMDQQHHRENKQMEDVRMWEYLEAKQGLAAGLRRKVCLTREQYMKEKLEKEKKEREWSLNYEKMVRELETHRTEERQLKGRIALLEKEMVQRETKAKKELLSYLKRLNEAEDTVSELSTERDILREKVRNVQAERDSWRQHERNVQISDQTSREHDLQRQNAAQCSGGFYSKTKSLWNSLTYTDSRPKETP